MITTCSGKYPPQISMEDVHGYDDQHDVPFINNLKYLKELSSYTSSERIKCFNNIRAEGFWQIKSTLLNDEVLDRQRTRNNRS